MALPGRSAARRRGASGGNLRPGIALSALLHLAFAVLVVLASQGRDKPPEPLPPPSYDVEFEGGAPDRPAEHESAASPPPEPETAPEQAASPEPPTPDPPVATAEPPPPEAPPAPPDDPAPPSPSEAPAATAEAEPPRPEDLPLPAPPPPPEAPTETAEAEAPRPEDLPLPAPPPAPPQREAALTAPPRPAAPPSNRLPGIYMPDMRLGPPGPSAPQSPRQPQRRGLDLSPGAIEIPGRESPDAQLSIRGAQVGPNWLSAFRRWLNEHVRYPDAAALLNEKGVSTIELVVDPDGRVRGWRLVRPSGSVWLDHGTVRPFRNAALPPFPPGADPNGVVVNLTIHWLGSR